MVQFISLFVLCSFVLTTPTTAGVLTGQVLDNEGRPLVGALIRLKNTRMGSLSKAPNGMFVVVGIAAGQYTVEISGVGHEPAVRIATIVADNATGLGAITLASKPSSCRATVVRGQRATESERATRIADIDSAALERSARTSIIDAIAVQQAYNTRERLCCYAVRLRTATEILVRIDGVEVTDHFTGGCGWTDASAYPSVCGIVVDEVQVIPNPVSAEYGDVICGIACFCGKRSHDEATSAPPSEAALVADPIETQDSAQNEATID